MEVTRTLARFVVDHEAVGHSAERPPRSGALVPELAGLRGRRRAGTRRSSARSRRSRRSPAPRRRRCSGARDRARHHAGRAHERHHVAHVRFRRHASEDRHPSERAGRLRDPRARRAHSPSRARDFLHAFILGVEVECRIGNAVYPEHYDVGWHITGTAGVFGAAAAAGKLLGLTEQQMVWALGIAATQSSGLREMFGTMCKPFHPGQRRAQRAARGAARAARTSPARIRASKRSAASRNVLSTAFEPGRDHRRAGRDVGDRAQHLQAVRVRHRHPPDHRRAACSCATSTGSKPDDIEAIERESPSARAGADRQEDAAGRARRASSASTTPPRSRIIHGAAGEAEYSDAVVRDPQVIGAARPRERGGRQVACTRTRRASRSG